MSPLEAVKKTWYAIEIASTLFTVVIAGLLLQGWRIGNPQSRFEKLEREALTVTQRVDAMALEHTQLTGQLHLLERLNCLQISRHDADLAGACAHLPTKDNR